MQKVNGIVNVLHVSLSRHQQCHLVMAAYLRANAMLNLLPDDTPLRVTEGRLGL